MPAVGSHDVLGDGEAEARALLGAREAIVDAIELLKNALVLAGGNAQAVVLDGDPDLARRWTLHARRRSRPDARRICWRW